MTNQHGGIPDFLKSKKRKQEEADEAARIQSNKSTCWNAKLKYRVSKTGTPYCVDEAGLGNPSYICPKGFATVQRFVGKECQISIKSLKNKVARERQQAEEARRKEMEPKSSTGEQTSTETKDDKITETQSAESSEMPTSETPSAESSEMTTNDTQTETQSKSTTDQQSSTEPSSTVTTNETQSAESSAQSTADVGPVNEVTQSGKGPRVRNTTGTDDFWTSVQAGTEKFLRLFVYDNPKPQN
jgi:hypothetical protein